MTHDKVAYKCITSQLYVLQLWYHEPSINTHTNDRKWMEYITNKYQEHYQSCRPPLHDQQVVLSSGNISNATVENHR